MSYFAGFTDNVQNYATTDELSSVNTSTLNDGDLATITNGKMYMFNKTTTLNPSGTDILAATGGGKWYEYFYATGKNYVTMNDGDNSISVNDIDATEINADYATIRGDLTIGGDDRITVPYSINTLRVGGIDATHSSRGDILANVLELGDYLYGGYGQISMYSLEPGQGSFRIWCEDNPLNKTSILNNSSVTGTRHYSLPDPAAGTTTSVTCNIVLDKGDMTIAGIKTFSTSVNSPNHIVTGTSSGAITIKGSAAAGTYNFNLPTTAGTSGQYLKSGAGGSTAMTWETMTGSFSTLIQTVANVTYAVQAYAPFAGTITGLGQIARAITTPGTMSININGTPVTGLGSVVPSTSATFTAGTAANTFAAGALITVVYSASTAILDHSLSIIVTR